MHTDFLDEWPGWEDASGLHADISAISGRVFSQDVRRVQIKLDNGMSLDASLETGFDIEWWPFKASVHDVTALDQEGNALAHCAYSGPSNTAPLTPPTHSSSAASSSRHLS